ncbi:Neuronal acetylcholine receptor subunit beta-3 [Seminavis robusta]|uniref:Neuronal acetylcholine receptor subunit beta-3 n=1 Tax=Seminavis robusta TaxID=568900 RepID=A0A9N8HIQ6_9STRA|nr:Neuronal acetylcholine receptor subunit beta-3 [Seminavis robusta]|eukprot:Sro610_g175090.1 Neuronal acetylcholine receptor subunit beta-3 (976) ;mRNA; r:374-3432
MATMLYKRAATRHRLSVVWVVLMTVVTVASFTFDLEEDFQGKGDGPERAGVTFDIIPPVAASALPPTFAPTGSGGDAIDDSARAKPVVTGNNIIQGQPFNFTHIFFIGGKCDNPNDWYSEFAAAGVQTINRTKQIKQICYSPEEFDPPENQVGWYQYTGAFHVDALHKVEAMVGDELSETLVITVGIGIETNFTPVVDFLRRGLAFFHGGYSRDLLTINFTEHGLSENDVLYIYFNLDEDLSAQEAGREICRLRGTRPNIRIAKLYSRDREDLDFRIDIAIESFREACSETTVNVAWEMRESDNDPNTNSAYRTALKFNQVPEVIFTAQDGVAERILNVASEVLPKDVADRISATGWNANNATLVDQRKILTTVDQLVFHPGRGLWDKVDTIIDIVQESGVNSTKSLQQALRIGNDLNISSSTLTISSDKVGYLINALLNGYDSRVGPFLNVSVTTGLFDVSITEMIPFEGKFQTVIWMRWSWLDPRLSWNPFIYDGALRIEADQIWTPDLFFRNSFESEELHASPAVVDPSGWVTLEANMQTQFLCTTDRNLASFPFDDYECSIDLAAPYGIWLDQGYGFDIIESDPHFNTTGQLQNETTAEELTMDTSDGTLVRYVIIFERRAFTAWVRLILPAIIINMIGFMAFWIPEMPESVALGITSLLCSLAFRETVEMPDTADVTWTELFMMVNISYQASVMLIIWLSYGDRSNFTKNLDECCYKFHPKHMLKRLGRAPVEVVRTAPSVTRKIVEYSGGTRRSEKMASHLSKDVYATRHLNRPSGDLPKVNATRQLARPSSDLTREETASKEFSTSREFSLASKRASTSIHADDDEKHSSMPGIPEEDLPVPNNENWCEIDMEAMEEDIIVPLKAEQESAKPKTLRKRTKFLIQDSVSEIGASVTAATSPVGRYDASDDGMASSDDGMSKKSKRHQYHGDDPDGDGDGRTNVDWIGRWIIVPSYVVVMGTLLTTGWGF